MQSKNNMKRKGFTLVELLIVIVVIGILSAMMMLSSTEAVTSAKASNVVSNLRNLKTAALSYYVDNLDHWETTVATDEDANAVDISKIKEYLNNSNVAGANDGGGFTYGTVIRTPTGGGTHISDAKWYLTCKVTDVRVQQKLAGRAQSVGLLSGTSKTTTEAGKYEATTSDAEGSSSGSDTVYMLVR